MFKKWLTSKQNTYEFEPTESRLFENGTIKWNRKRGKSRSWACVLQCTRILQRFGAWATAWDGCCSARPQTGIGYTITDEISDATPCHVWSVYLQSRGHSTTEFHSFETLKKKKPLVWIISLHVRRTMM